MRSASVPDAASSAAHHPPPTPPAPTDAAPDSASPCDAHARPACANRLHRRALARLHGTQRRGRSGAGRIGDVRCRQCTPQRRPGAHDARHPPRQPRRRCDVVVLRQQRGDRVINGTSHLFPASALPPSPLPSSIAPAVRRSASSTSPSARSDPTSRHWRARAFPPTASASRSSGRADTGKLSRPNYAHNATYSRRHAFSQMRRRVTRATYLGCPPSHLARVTLNERC